MTRGSSATVTYVYGLVRAKDFDASTLAAVQGIDDAGVDLAAGKGGGRIAALVSHLPAAEFDVETVERMSGDVSWLSPRAMAHDRVLTWAQDHGGVIPMAMFSLWKSPAALARSLSAHEKELEKTFRKVAGADEYGLRVHRRDSVILESIGSLDEEIAALRREADAATPGQRYLLERKIADRSKGAMRAASQRMAREAFDMLRSISSDAVARPLTPTPEATGVPDATLVLNAVFLVPRGRVEGFRAAVGELVRTYQPHGLVFDFTGPWPPYHFVGGEGSAAAALKGSLK